jgi:hypothetical protein
MYKMRWETVGTIAGLTMILVLILSAIGGLMFGAEFFIGVFLGGCILVMIQAGINRFFGRGY